MQIRWRAPLCLFMKIEWFLSDLDKSVRTYIDLRKQLQDLPANSPNYDKIERELKRQLRQLKLDLDNTLTAVSEETDS